MTSPRIVALSLSPAWDLTIRAAALEPGTSHRVPAAIGRLGGKAVNVARVLAEVGAGVYIHGPVERASWPEGVGDGDRAAVGTGAGISVGRATASVAIWELTPTPTPLRRSYAIVEDDGRATVLNETAQAQPAEVWATVLATAQRRLTEPQVRVLVVSGSTPADLPENFFSELITAAHDAGVDVIVDTSAQGLLAAAQAGADWLKPNAEELAELFGARDWADAAGELINAGAGQVLVSRGAEGMALVDGSGPRMTAHLGEELSGNPTGAGDAGVAALAWQLAEMNESGRVSHLDDDAVRRILIHAVGISASAVLMPQAGQIHPSWPELTARVTVNATAAAATPPPVASPTTSARTDQETP